MTPKTEVNVVKVPIARISPSVHMANEPTPVRASVSVPANVPMERMIASVSEQNDPRLQDGEVTNLYNNLVNQREHSPTRPAPPPASPSYTGINDEEDQWVRTHPGWCEGHPLMYETRVRSMSFGPWSFIKKPIDILCCLPPPARRAPIREPWSAANQGAVKSSIVTFETLAMKYLADHMMELLAADEVLNEKRGKIGGTSPWEEISNLIFCESNDRECSNKQLRQIIKDERSCVDTVAAMLFAAENLAEVMIFAINLRNQMNTGEAMQKIMLCVMQAIKFTSYKKRIEIMKPGVTYITTSSGIRPLLVMNELIFTAAENRTTKLINDSKANAFALNPFSLLYSRNECNVIEFRTTTTPISEIALANEYEFSAMVHVNKDGLITADTETLQRNNGATNILHGMGRVLVIPIRPGFIDQQPRRRSLTLMLFNLYGSTLGCFIPKNDTHQFKNEYRDHTPDMPDMRPTYSRRLLLRLPIFHEAQESVSIKPLDHLYNTQDLMEVKKSLKRTWEQSVFTKKSE